MGGAYHVLARIFCTVVKSDYQQLIRINPNDATGHYLVGLVFKELGKIEDARVHLNRAAELGDEEASHIISSLSS